VSSTQTHFHVRRIVAEALGFPINNIRVIKPRIGGGYGGKQALHGELLTSLVTIRTGKPAKLVYSRQDVFEASYSRHPMRIVVTIGADKEANIKAIDMSILSNTGAYGEHALTVFMVAGSKTLPLYNKAAAVHFGGTVVYTNNTPAGAFRGYGAIQGNFALESTIDILAENIGMDAMKLRAMNMIKE
jgi:CO/xanthine dehydrogenase Mo-binding subunit